MLVGTRLVDVLSAPPPKKQAHAIQGNGDVDSVAP